MQELVRCSRARSLLQLNFNRLFYTFYSYLTQNRPEPDPINENPTRISPWLLLAHHPNPEISQFPVKGFSEITNKITGKSLHCLYVKGMIPFSVLFSNTLITMYVKLGSIDHAHQVFDEMPMRNEASWNNMVSGFVKVGLYRKGFELFGEMRRDGFGANGFVVSSLVTGCSRAVGMVSEALQIHGFAVVSDLLDDVFVGTSLLHLYGVCGFLGEAREVFRAMPVKNTVSWTALMVGYSDDGQPGGVVDIYQQMRQEGVACSVNTLTVVISSCGMLGDEALGFSVLGHVIKFGFESNVSVSNSLVSMFDYFGSLEDASYVFDSMMERDTISWNSIITAFGHHRICEKALGYFSRMRFVHNEVNFFTLSGLLLACNSVDNVKWGRGIHGLAFKFGFDSDVCVCNTFLTMYSEAGMLEDAEFLFRAMPKKDLISWNSMITCYAQNGRCIQALRVLKNLLRARISMNHIPFASALAACSRQEFLAKGHIVHAIAVVAGLASNQIVGNSLVSMYANCGLMGKAKQIFDLMPEQDIVSWNALIGGYAEKEANEALRTFKLMRRIGLPANYITMVNLLASISSPNVLLTHGMPVHAHIVLKGIESDEYVKNSLITMYAKCGDLDSSGVFFNKSVNITSVTYNAMIAANARHGQGEEALRIFTKMYNLRVNLDQFSFSAAFAAAANLATLEEGKMLHGLTVKLGVDMNLHVINAAMDMYGKCGDLNDVLKILPEPANRSLPSWNILISTYARHGLFGKAIGTFHEMVDATIKPNYVTFVSLLSACSHGGHVNEGLRYYSSMTTDFGIPPGIEHCVCVIDLLGRSGRFFETENFLKEMPVPPNGFVWRSLLASCKIHGNLELAKRAAEQLIKLGPDDDSAYVLYSNVCASTGNWKDVETVRNQMELINLKKKPACSWVKLKNRISSFGIGDQTHQQANLIYAKLNEIKKLITEAGYVPDTSFALHDTDEEQKEHNLWDHSERLALSYALINTPKGSTIRIFKNLRVCGDCHSVYKFVSRIVAREIFLRDPYRFHHFKDGKCSCGDFW